MKSSLFSRWVRGLCALCALQCIRPQHAHAAETGRPLSDVIAVAPGTRCLDKSWLIVHIALWLGRARVSSDVRVTVHEDPSAEEALAFDITRGDNTWHRAFKSSPSSCDDVHAVLGLAIAFAMDSDHVQPLVAITKPAPRAVHRFALQLAAAHDVLPGASFALQLGAELMWLPWLSARADGFVHWSPNDQIPGSRGHFDALLSGGSLQLCGGGSPSAVLRFAICAGAAGGVASAWGRDYAPNQHHSGPWLAARSGLRVEARLGVFWLLDLEVFSAIISTAFEAERDGAPALARSPKRSGFGLSVGPALAF